MSQEFLEFEEPEEQQEVSEMGEGSSESQGWGAKWKSASKRWAKETKLSYLSNPATRKDFRVQFRGNRSVWLFGTFLLALGGIALFEYWSIASQGLGAFESQSRLVDFYHTIMVVLGVVVGLVTPALAAGAIVAEKQRKSLDLVFSSPVRPRVYLVGKLMASFRYTWILLGLSLPFTAMSVLLGGASWGEIASAYVLLSLQGLVFTSIGLLFSSLVEKTMSALLYTYGTVVAYVLATIGLGAMTYSYENSLTGGNDGPFAFLLNPITLFESLGSVTHIGPVPVPNILLAAATLLFMVRLCLGAAGAALVPPNRAEAAKLRLTAASTFAGLLGITAFLWQTTLGSRGDLQGDLTTPFYLVIGSALFAVFMPFLACYGFDGDQRSRPNGLFSVSKTLSRTPAGALPYVLLTIFLGGAACWLGSVLGGGHPDLAISSSLTLYVAGFWTFFWACGRYASSFLLGLRASRTVQFILFVGLVGAPLPVLAAFASNYPGLNIFGPDFFLSKLYLLWPLFASGSQVQVGGFVAYGLLLAVLGWLLAWWSEGNMKRRLARKGKGLSDIARATGAMPS